MQPIYATPAQLADYMGEDDPPADATVLLRSASRLVRNATLASLYHVDSSTGLPTAQRIADAFTEATCEQAQAWSMAGVDPRRGAGQAQRRVASKSLAGASVTYLTDPAADSYLSDLAAGDSLTVTAWMILSNAGLISNRVNAYPAYIEPLIVPDPDYDGGGAGASLDHDLDGGAA